jgi:hypothetical protein
VTALDTARPKLPPMPRISEFFGIEIYMYYNDHLPPHFHARYQHHFARIDIASGEVTGGQLPTRAERLVREWAALRRAELDANWQRARSGVSLMQIAPLE